MYKVSFDRQNIENLIRDFGKMIPGRISFFDTETVELIGYEQNLCRFCKVLENDATALKKCKQCDMAAFNSARETKSLYLYECHAGLTEGVIPILYDNKLLGYLMLGKLINVPPDEQMWQKIYKKCSNYDVDFHALKESLFNMESIGLERIYAAARIMEMSARYLYMAKLVKVQNLGLMKRIEEFVIGNIDKNLSISDVSKHTNFSKSYLSNKIKTHFNTSFGQYIIDKKMEIAKSMLEETNLKISQVAEKVGYSDLSYFSRIFKRITGCSPREYRAVCEKK